MIEVIPPLLIVAVPAPPDPVAVLSLALTMEIGTVPVKFEELPMV